MNSKSSRRRLLAGLLTAVSAMTLATVLAEEASHAQEFYEIRIYRCPTAEKQHAVISFVESALLPALNRQKIDRVGIFTPAGENADSSVYVVIKFVLLVMIV